MSHNWKGRSSGHSVFRTIMLPLLLLLVVEMALAAGSVVLSGVVGRLDQNARDILSKQVQNRASYLENAMVGTWSDLSRLAETINTATQSMLDDGTLSLDALDSGSDACAPLLLHITDDLITTLYSKKVSGIFVVFNTADLSASRTSGVYEDRPGIYIRDQDPSSPQSARNADLLLERAPISVVQGLNISTDSGWHPLFSFDSQDQDYYDFLYEPFQAAYTAQRPADAEEYGYWSATPFTLRESDLSAVSYSLPLVLEDGTVYGVLGIDLLTDYLRTMLPYDELFDDKQGSYLLAVDREGAGRAFSTTLVSGSVQQQLDLEQAPLSLTPSDRGGLTFGQGTDTYYADVHYLSLYNTNTPFSGQRWALIGAVQTDKLYAFSTQVTLLLILAGLLNLIAGVVGSFIVSRRLSQPIQKLSEEVDQAQRDRGGIPSLSATGIREIDRFSGAITELSRDVVAASTRLLRIMDMASVELGGFELREGEDAVFVTDNYFPLLGVQDVDPAALTAERFRSLSEHLYVSLSHTSGADGSTLYEIPLPQGGVRYVRVEVTEDGGRQVGLAEDVTAATLERLRIEHERDYDLLSGLLNRRAFYRLAEELFRQPDRLGHAALVMLDLDNLKTTNDRFGHDWGDQYIRQAGKCFANGVPAGTLCARVSGDEFFLLLSGFHSRTDLRGALDALSQAIRDSDFSLPDGERTHICASGGVAWYPEDSRDFNELMKYADFAMYQVKQTQKGRLGDFDLGVYNRENFLVQNRREFMELMEKELVSYHFQPIVDGKTGAILAYEALMRVSMPTLRSPDAVLKLAREEGRLHEIERLTWFKSAETFQSLLEQQLVAPDALLFVNSIASQHMGDEERNAFIQRFSPILPHIVVEITEAEDMDPKALRIKRDIPGFSGRFALDDYGSGYNSERNLLELSPKYIKVDLSIVRDIDADPDKQGIVSNIVGYAHARGMLIIAEGLETPAEVRTVLELGVDLLQGYYLARPAAVPAPVAPVALDLIREFQSRCLL